MGRQSETRGRPFDRSTSARRCGRGLAIVVAVLLAPGVMWAASGTVQTLPPSNVKPKNRVTLTLDSRGVEANGYRPVRIELTNWPPGPTTADRVFRVVLQPRAARPGLGPRVTAFVELPEGSTRATKTVCVPQTGPWQWLGVQVREGGVLLEDVSAPVTTMGVNAYEWSEALPAFLIIDSDAPDRDQRTALLNAGRLPGADLGTGGSRFPDLRRLHDSLADASVVQNSAAIQSFYAGARHGSAAAAANDLLTLRIVQDSTRIEMLPPSALPTAWIEYTGFDLAIISREDLRKLIPAQRARWQALRQWVSAGATLVVYDADLSPAGLEELERLLALPSRPAAPSSRDRDSSGWRQPDERHADQQLRGWQIPPQGRRVVIQPPGPVETAPAVEPATVEVRPAQTPFLIRPLGLGRVVAQAGTEPFAPGKYGFAWVLNELELGNLAWCQRHGLSFSRENNDFWNWTIPGVGRAPVGAFLLFISLFAIVIGPVNYWFLHKKRRLYLLLVTVPGGAALVTLALFAYAIIADGLGTRVRVRSFTHLDQRLGQATTWSRQCYYAGIAPSRGLEFPGDAAVYPLEQFPGERADRSEGGERQLVWDERQRLAAGYLPSRTSCQFLVVRAHATERRLVIGDAALEEQPLEVINNLGTAIERVVLCDARGALLGAEGVAADARFQPRPVESADVLREYGLALSRNRPAFPPEYQVRFGRSYGPGRRYFAVWNNLDSSLGTPTVETSLLERALAHMATEAAGGLPPRSYIAIVKQAPEQMLGVATAREEGSFHVVAGTW